MRLARYLGLAFLTIMAACAPYSLIPPAKTDVAGFEIDTQIAWNKENRPSVDSSAPIEIWTADGPQLNSLLFVGGVASGDPLLHWSGTKPGRTFVFRDGMTPSEIVELWEDAITKLNHTTIADATNIQPANFLGTTGFSFDFTYVGGDEVDRSGIGYAAVKNGRLYMIFYSGTKLYHYNLRLKDAMHIIQTARLAG